MGRMPRRRTYLGEEPFHLRLVRDQLAVEVPGVPIEQDATHVEHHRLDLRGPGNLVRTHISYGRVNIVDVHTRHQMILQALSQRSPVLVGELAGALDCSEMT